MAALAQFRKDIGKFLKKRKSGARMNKKKISDP
jgi:hypothetical protein